MTWPRGNSLEFRGAVLRHRSSISFQRGGVASTSLVLILLIATSCVTTRSAPRSDSRSELNRTLDRVLDDARRRLGIPGIQAAIVFPDGRTWTGTAGVADVGADADVTDDSLFGIGSITKPVVAALILDLQEEGLLDIDDPVVRWLPGLHVSREMTLRHLLSHTSGLAELMPRKQPLEEVWVEWKARASKSLKPKMACRPGGCWTYSNLNYIALGLIAERAGSAGVQQQLEDRFLAPLDLDHVFLQGDVAAPSDLVRGYEFDLVEPDVSRRDFTAAAWTAGGIVATASDIAAFFDDIFDGEVLTKSSLQEMTDVSLSDHAGVGPCHPYGLGIELSTSSGGERTWTHSGMVPGYRSEMTYLPDSHVTVVVLINLSGRFPMEISQDLVDVLREHDVVVRQGAAPCNTDLYSKTGETEDRITSEPAIDGATITSNPSGSEIIFTSAREGVPQLFRIALGSDTGTRISPGSGPNAGAAWSPDGKEVVYSDASDGDGELVLLDLDTGERVQLTDNDVPDAIPTWSPDGDAIAFSRGVWGARDVWMLDLETDEEERLTSALADEWWPTWSPDGAEIAYVNDSDGTIDVIDVEHSDYRRLTSDEGVDAFPAWGPTGTIAFVREGDIWTMNSQGHKRRRVTHSSYFDFGPSWSPDGKTLFYGSERPNR